MDKNFGKNLIAASALVALALFFGLWLHGRSMGDRSVGKSLTVTGSVKKSVTSDLAKWNASFSRRANLTNLKETFTAVENDRSKITKFVVDLGLDEKSITFLPAQSNPVYEQLPGYGYTQNVVGYSVSQEVKVESGDIDKIEKLANEVKNLVAMNIIPDYQRTEYYYTKLAELRPILFADATKDAKERAEAIAKGGNATVAGLQSARTGVVQVMQPNSTDVNDYGTYDLSTREKEVSATVSVTFGLKY